MPQVAVSLSLRFAPFPEAAEHRRAAPRAQVLRWVRAALQGDVQSAEIGIRVVDEAEGLRLNAQYRHKDYATNVLTFAYEIAPQVSADLVLCAPVLAREAQAQHKPLTAHYAHLIVHGVLHAQGWDHEISDADAEKMQNEEIRILTRLGFASPYADD